MRLHSHQRVSILNIQFFKEHLRSLNLLTDSRLIVSCFASALRRMGYEMEDQAQYALLNRQQGWFQAHDKESYLLEPLLMNFVSTRFPVIDIRPHHVFAIAIFQRLSEEYLDEAQTDCRQLRPRGF